jgi:pSer/pThr/pTyr-binding forkhead associated (FHA) protein
MNGPDIGLTFELNPGLTLLGRIEANTNDPESSQRLCLTDKTVSRTHSEISWNGQKPPLLTHSSLTNDTFLDGKKILSKSIHDGQIIQMGQTILGVQIEVDYGWDVRTTKTKDISAS